MRRRLVGVSLLGVTLLTFALSIGLLVNFDSGDAGFQLGNEVEWIPEWGIGYVTGLDGASLWMIMLTTFLMPIAVLVSWSIVKREIRGRDIFDTRRSNGSPGGEVFGVLA